MDRNHHSIILHALQQTQEVNPLAALGYTVSAVPWQPLSFVLFGRFDKKGVMLFTIDPKAKHFKGVLFQAQVWQLQSSCVTGSASEEKTSWIYRNGLMNRTSFHKKPTATDLSWQGALITSVKHKTWVSCNTPYGKKLILQMSIPSYR